MKWKSDSIEQFVKYKIMHPEECYQSLKNYQAQKKHNQELDQLYKELNKCRLEQNHFKSELHKLNQITQNQVFKNSNEINLIDQKCQQISQKLTLTKENTKIHLGKGKKKLIKQYQALLSTETQSFRLQQTTEIQTIENLKNKLSSSKIQNHQQTINKQIEITKKKLGQAQQKSAQIKTKKQSLRFLSQRLQTLNTQVESKQLFIKSKKQKQIQIKNLQQQTQLQQYQQTENKLKEFNFQLKQIIVKNIISYTIKQNEYVHNFSSEASLDEQILGGQQVLFNPHIDFNYKKKKNSLTSTHNEKKESISSIDQIEQNILQVQQFLIDKRKLYSIDYKSDPSVSTNNEKSSLQEESSAVGQLEQESLSYLLTKFNDSSTNLHTTLDNLIKTLSDQVETFRSEADSLYNLQKETLQREESQLQKRQKDLDKQIQHLQSKVSKTNLEISKKYRVTL